MRLRLPPGFDSVEAEVRARLGKTLSRGTCYATLAMQRDGLAPEVRINEALLHRLAEAVAGMVSPTLRPASLDGLLALRGVVEIRDAEDDKELLQVQQDALTGLDQAISALLAMRQSEGAALGEIVAVRFAKLAALCKAADASAARQPEAIRAKLADLIAQISGGAKFDEARLYQEALLLAAKADVREELDRLKLILTPLASLLRAGDRSGGSSIFSPRNSPRGQYFMRQVHRCGLNRDGLEFKRRDRAIARAGPKHRMKAMNERKDKAGMARSGLMLILSSPSGAGKTS